MKFVIPFLIATLWSPLTAIATHYSCDISVEFSGSSDAAPSTAERKFYEAAASKAYKDVHNSATSGDFDMDYIKMVAFATERANSDILNGERKHDESSDEDNDINSSKGLRGSSTAVEDRRYNYFWLYYGFFIAEVHCELCKNWDDDEYWALGDEEEEGKELAYADPVAKSIESSADPIHFEWEKKLCSTLDASPFDVFNKAENCFIRVKNCIPTTEEAVMKRIEEGNKDSNDTIPRLGSVNDDALDMEVIAKES